jgi:SAM-dependent methyltransferase
MEYAEWRYMRQWNAEESKRLGESRGPLGVGRGSHGAGNVVMVELADDYLRAVGSSIEVRLPALHDNGDFVKFDVVICTEVIEHVPEPEPFVWLLAKMVKPGGILVATTSFHDDGTIPMHLNVDKYTDEGFAAEVFPRHGLVRVEESVYRKE